MRKITGLRKLAIGTLGLAAVVGGTILLSPGPEKTNFQQVNYAEKYLEQNCPEMDVESKKELMRSYSEVSNLPKGDFNELVRAYEEHKRNNEVGTKEERREMFPWINNGPHDLDKAAISKNIALLAEWKGEGPELDLELAMHETRKGVVYLVHKDNAAQSAIRIAKRSIKQDI